MIFPTSLPRFKAFLNDSLVQATDLSCCLLFLASFLVPTARRSVTAASQAILSDVRNAGWLLRWLGWSQAPAALLAAAQWQLLLAAHARPERLHVLAVDATQHGQQGAKTENTFSRGNTRARPQKSGRAQKSVHRRSCHCFVFALLLTPCGLRIPYWLPYYTRDHCALFSLVHQSQASLAAQLIDRIPLPAGSRVVVVGDTAFEAKQVRQACARRGWSWVVPINPERRLAGPAPRPQVRSLFGQMSATDFHRMSFRLDRGEYAALARSSPRRLQSCKNERTYWVHHRIAKVHNVGPVALLFSTKKAPTSQQVQVQKVLISNAVEASAEELLCWYSLRWQIELFFKEMKSELGLCQYKLGPFVRVKGWVDLSVLAYCYLEWYRWRKEQEGRGPERPYWQRLRTAGLKDQIRRRVQQGEVEELLRLGTTQQGRKQLTELRRKLRADPEARAA